MMDSSYCIHYMAHNLISPIIGDINIDPLTKDLSDDFTAVKHFFML